MALKTASDANESTSSCDRLNIGISGPVVVELALNSKLEYLAGTVFPIVDVIEAVRFFRCVSSGAETILMQDDFEIDTVDFTVDDNEMRPDFGDEIGLAAGTLHLLFRLRFFLT